MSHSLSPAVMDALAQLPRISSYENSFQALHELAKVVDTLPAELTGGPAVQPDRFVFLRAPEVKLAVIRIYRNMGQSAVVAEKTAAVLLSGTMAAARKYPKSYPMEPASSTDDDEELSPPPLLVAPELPPLPPIPLY